jgi:hypothetical protein
MRLTFEARDTKLPQMYIFAEPYEEEEIEAIQNGEYFQALRMAEERARAEAAEAAERAEVLKAKSAESAAESTTADEPVPTAESEFDETQKMDESSDALAERVISTVETPAFAGPDETFIPEEAAADRLVAEDEEALSDSAQTDVEEAISDSMQTDATEKPQVSDRGLLSMVLKAQSFINGTLCTTSPSPSGSDKWEMAFTFEDYSDDRGRRLHQMSESRRRKALDEEYREQASEGNDTAKKAKEWSQGFRQHLKSLSQKGKAWRQEFDKKNAEKGKVVWREGRPPSRYGDMAWREQQKEEHPTNDHS